MEEMEELTCREVVEVATDHLEGALPAAAVDRLVRHLTGCAGCRAYLEQLRLAIRLLSLIGGRGPSSGRR
jgi:predicted anti-sigma-YlaC factor YlaD